MENPGVVVGSFVTVVVGWVEAVLTVGMPGVVVGSWETVVVETEEVVVECVEVVVECVEVVVEKKLAAHKIY